MNPLLKMAVLSGATRAVELHLGKTADINIKDDKGMTLLMYAAMKGHSETCKMLLEAGADPYMENHERKTALCLTKAFGQSDAMAVLLDYMQQVQQVTDSAFSVAPRSESDDYKSVSSSEDNDNSVFSDSSGWIEDVENTPPEDDKSILDEAVQLQKHISSCRPVDSDEEWDDVDVNLPEIIWSATKAHLQHEGWQIEKNLIISAINTGRLVLGQIDIMSEHVGEQDFDYSERLMMVLTDLGVRIDGMTSDFIYPTSIDFEESEVEEDDEMLANDALHFLWEMNNPAHDPCWLYLKEARKISLLSKEDECEIGIQAENGKQELIKAVSYCPPAVSFLLAKVNDASSGLILIDSITVSKSESELYGVDGDELFEVDEDADTEKMEGEEDAENALSLNFESFEKFESIQNLHFQVLSALEQKERSPIARHLLHEEIYKNLSQISLNSNLLTSLVNSIQETSSAIQSSERLVYKICTENVGMSSDDFHALFAGHETNLDWCATIITAYKDELGAKLAPVSCKILDEQLKLLELKKQIGIPFGEFKLLSQKNC